MSRCAPDHFTALAARELDFSKLMNMKCGRSQKKLCGWLIDTGDILKSALFINGMELDISAKSFAYIMGIGMRNFCGTKCNDGSCDKRERRK